MAKELITDCADREGGTQADADHILARKLPAAKIHKCINACVGESVGLVSSYEILTHTKMFVLNSALFNKRFNYLNVQCAVE